MIAPTVAILAHRGDAAAVALATLLRRRGRCQVIYAEELALAGARIRHRPSSGPLNGERPDAGAMPGDMVQLPTGVTLGPDTAVLVCRLTSLAPARQTNADHQGYAEAESFAYALSWLAGLGDAVVNRPTPMGLPGIQPDLLRLQQLAAGVGLTVPRFQVASNAAQSGSPAGLRPVDWTPPGLPLAALSGPSVSSGPPLPRPVLSLEPVQPIGAALVLDRQVIGAPPGLESRLAALAADAGLRVAEVGLARNDGGATVVTELCPVPRLTTADQLTGCASFLERLAHQRSEEQAA